MTEIITKKHKGLGQVILNRPQALNALSLEMVRALRTALKDFAADDDIKAVLLTSNSDKAFCAGGDVKSVALATQDPEKKDLCYDIFFEEYNLNHEIHNYPKCFVSLIDGICMGGGAGISLHGNFVVVSDKTSFAMPEVFIGFFPDVGSGEIFNRIPRSVAMWLLLTGARISGTELYKLGLATHYIESRGIQALAESLINTDWRRSEAVSILKSQLTTYCESTLPEDDFDEKIRFAKNHFNETSVAAIIESLKQSQNSLSKDAFTAMSKAAPLSMALTMQHMDWARKKNIEDILNNEFRLSQYFVRQTDFYEGVRCVLIDKSGQPDWKVDLNMIDAALYEAIQEDYKEFNLDKDRF